MGFTDEMIGVHFAKSKIYTILSKISKFLHFNSPIVLYFLIINSLSTVYVLLVVTLYFFITRILWVKFYNSSKMHKRICELRKDIKIFNN